MAVPLSAPQVSAPSSSGKTVASAKPAAKKRTRIPRRRGRVDEDIHSDDEIEREAGSDSSDDDSFVPSESESETEDSETEPVSEDVPSNEPSRIITASTSQSPDAQPTKPPALVKAAESTNGSHGPFVADAQNWSDMVADEDVNGVADLPVIDFTDLNEDVVQAATPAAGSQKPKHIKQKPRPTPAPGSTEAPDVPSLEHDGFEEAQRDEHQPIASTSRSPTSTRGRGTFPRRGGTQSARLAYQQRLEKDPSFVPTVGEFWSHDERLLDKDLRSLSGWWRGKWQGRGRGFPPGMRGRGRGGFYGQPREPQREDEENGTQEEVPPIERMWTHDGFEEMKAREERRRQALEQRERREVVQTQRGGPNLPSRGGRGWFGGRGSGFVPAPTRGGFANRGRGASPIVANGHADRIWYTQKPERVWTKQHEGYLYYDISMKPRPGVGQGFKIRLPGGDGYVVRSPPTPRFWGGERQERQVTSTSKAADKAGSEYSDVIVVVRLPQLEASKEEALKVSEITQPEPPTTVLPTPKSDHSPLSPPTAPKQTVVEETSVSAASAELPGPVVDGATSTAPADIPQQASSPQEAQPNPTAPSEAPQPVQPPRLQPLTIPVFAPASAPPAHIAEPTPSYGSPYGYPQLPPGVAVAQNGVPYEVSTGRPVILQPTPPPHPQGPSAPPMFSPRPYAAPFVPGHMHHHSSVSTPDFAMRANHSRPGSISGFLDPNTGTPIFTPARQSSRVEIRAPSAGGHDGFASSSAPRPSPLRTAVAAEGQQGLSAPDSTSADSREQHPQQQHMMDPTMMPYNPYQPQPGPQYYYPDQYGYYMDPAMQPYPQYDIYHQPPPGSEHHVPMPPQGTVYY